MVDMSWLDNESKATRKWIEDNFLPHIRTEDMPGGYEVGDRVIVQMGNGTEGDAIVLGWDTAANGDPWLMMRGFPIEGGLGFPAWESPLKDVRKA
jgi:hypothetical protein